MNNNSSKLFVRLTYLYVVLPVLIFVVGWCNLPTACIGGTIILTSLYLTWKNAPALWKVQTEDQKRMLFLIALISFVWAYLSGIGALVFQNVDHATRNPTFTLLVNHAWPFVLDNPPAIFTYYIGFWLPPALVGKLLHSVQLGFYAQMVWATIGIFLFFYLLLSALKHKSYWPVFLFILFSGLDVLGCLGTEYRYLLKTPWSHIEWWYPNFQFSSFTTQLFWVFNQAIPTWVLVMLLFHEKNNKSLLFLYSCAFLQGTWPTVGLFPFIVYWYFKNNDPKSSTHALKERIKRSVISSLTWPNIAGALCVIIITFAYLTGNISADKRFTVWATMNVFKQTHLVHWFFIFFLPEVGLYLLCLWRTQRKNGLYYLCLACFLIYPFLRTDSDPNFCMRATFAALVILFVLVVQTLQDKDFRQKHRLSFFAILLLLGLGSITPLHEFIRTIHFTRTGYTLPASQLVFHQFFGWKQGNLFLKYFGK